MATGGSPGILETALDPPVRWVSALGQHLLVDRPALLFRSCATATGRGRGHCDRGRRNTSARESALQSARAAQKGRLIAALGNVWPGSAPSFAPGWTAAKPAATGAFGPPKSCRFGGEAFSGEPSAEVLVSDVCLSWQVQARLPGPDLQGMRARIPAGRPEWPACLGFGQGASMSADREAFTA